MTIGINLEGGLIQSIAVLDRDGRNIAVVVDYDIADSDPDDLTEIPQPNGGTRDGYVHEMLIEQWPNDATTQWYMDYAGVTG